MNRMQEKIQEILARFQWRGSNEAEQVAFDQWLDSPEGQNWLDGNEKPTYETTAFCWE